MFARVELFGKPGTLTKRASKAQLQFYKHGQYKDATNSGSFGHANIIDPTKTEPAQQERMIDDFHSPCAPDSYLNLRVEPQIRFYQSRLPVYYHSNFSFQVILLLASIGATLMAALGIAKWIPTMNAATTALMAWAAFRGVDQKVSRYSNTIEKVRTHAGSVYLCCSVIYVFHF